VRPCLSFLSPSARERALTLLFTARRAAVPPPAPAPLDEPLVPPRLRPLVAGRTSRPLAPPQPLDGLPNRRRHGRPLVHLVRARQLVQRRPALDHPAQGRAERHPARHREQVEGPLDGLDGRAHPAGRGARGVGGRVRRGQPRSGDCLPVRPSLSFVLVSTSSRALTLVSQHRAATARARSATHEPHPLSLSQQQHPPLHTTSPLHPSFVIPLLSYCLAPRRRRWTSLSLVDALSPSRTLSLLVELHYRALTALVYTFSYAQSLFSRASASRASSRPTRKRDPCGAPRPGPAQPRLRVSGSLPCSRALEVWRKEDCELERERAHARKPVRARERGITKYH